MAARHFGRSKSGGGIRGNPKGLGRTAPEEQALYIWFKTASLAARNRETPTTSGNKLVMMKTYARGNLNSRKLLAFENGGVALKATFHLATTA